MPPRLQEKGINLNTVIIVIGILGGIWSTVKLGGPIVNLPEQQLEAKGQIERVSQQIYSIERVQAVQTEALKSLAEVISEGRNTRRAVERNTQTLENVKDRLERIEKRP